MITINSGNDYVFVGDENINVMDVTVKINENYKSLESCTVQCVNEVLNAFNFYFPSRKLNLYLVGRSSSIPKMNVIQRRKGILLNPCFSSLSKKVDYASFRDIRGEYFLGMTRIDEEDYNLVFERVRKNGHNSFLFFSFEDECAHNQSFIKFFQVNWYDIIKYFCYNDKIPLKIDGNFDDREVSVSLFYFSDLKCEKK